MKLSCNNFNWGRGFADYDGGGGEIFGFAFGLNGDGRGRGEFDSVADSAGAGDSPEYALQHKTDEAPKTCKSHDGRVEDFWFCTVFPAAHDARYGDTIYCNVV